MEIRIALDKPREGSLSEIASYDYIVVGSGSSGAIVASRLSEDRSVDVLLVEAGKTDSNPWLAIPLGFAKVHFDERLTWRHETEPEPNMNNRRIPWYRGKVLGGSSSINALVYVRGTPLDYATWRQMGAKSWSYEDVLPYYKKAERQQRGADAYHGADGPLGVEDPAWKNPLADAWIQSAINVGLPANDDFSGATLEGAGYYQLTTDKGRRASTASAYLKPARNRSNLHVSTECLVTRIEVRQGAATGISYLQGGETKQASARREVILSAGAIMSPQLLQLSGIGPAAVLKANGIDVVHDLPGVGENLNDHVIAKRVYRVDSGDTFNAMMRSLRAKSAAGLRYALTRKGQLAVGGAIAGGFSFTRPGLDAPDVQLFYSPFAPKVGVGQLADFSGVHVSVAQNRPESRGTVRIRSSDPHDLPIIHANYLATELDRQTIVAGLRIVERIASADPFRRFVIEETEPGGKYLTDEDLLDWARCTGYTGWHHSGTCRMGADALAVVDPELRVHGLRNLRVVDGSVMPTVVSGNTNGACIMIGEKGADHIKAAAGGR